MKKITLLVVTLMIATISYAQNSGQWSFGAGSDFTSPNADANIGYFIMDGLMLSFNFNMGMEHRQEEIHLMDDGSTHIHLEDVEGTFEWGGAMRYYAIDNMFVEAGLSMVTDMDPDVYFAGGVSLKLAFEDKLWFEPMIKLNMPGADYSTIGNNEAQNTLGLAWAFRYTF